MKALRNFIVTFWWAIPVQMASRFALAVLLSVGVVRSAAAQEDHGVVVGGSVALAGIESSSRLSIDVDVAYRIRRFMSLGLEVMAVPTLKPDFSSAPDPQTIIYPGHGPTLVVFALRAEGGHATVFTTSVRVDAPPIWRRVAIYAATGAGIANITDRYQVTPSVSDPAVLFLDPTPHVESRAATDLAVTLTGGASVRVTRHTSVDLGVGVIRLIGEDEMTISRLSAGLRYRF